MRLVGAIGLAMLFAAEPASAQAPVTTQPLGANEVLLEVGAQGIARAPADQANIILQVVGRGATQAEARTALERALGQVRQTAAASGVAAGDVGPVRMNSIGAMMGMAGAAPRTPSTIDIDGSATEVSAEEQPVSTETSGIQITVRDLRRLASLRTALEALNVGTPAVTYELSDTAPARQQARAAGLAQARSHAEGYANAMGMRIARVVRVSERLSATGMGLEAYTSIMQMFLSAAAGGSEEQVEAKVDLSVDYALAPR